MVASEVASRAGKRAGIAEAWHHLQEGRGLPPTVAPAIRGVSWGETWRERESMAGQERSQPMAIKPSTNVTVQN